MESFELESSPFYIPADNPSGFFHGISLSRNRIPVVIQRLDFPHLYHKNTQQRLSQTLTAALVQAKVQHPNSLDILEIKLEFDKNSCTVYEVLENLDANLAEDMQEKRQKEQSYQEKELWAFLLQTAGALAAAHSVVKSRQGIAHKDIKPENIFRLESHYKVGNFGCFKMKREEVLMGTVNGMMKYMSPQLRAACTEGAKFSGLKADVYALGVTILEMANLPAVVDLEHAENAIEELNYSADLKALISSMLSVNENTRPTMQEVYSAAKVPVSPLTRSPSRISQAPLFPDMTNSLAYVETHRLKLWDFNSNSWEITPLQQAIEVDVGSRYVWMENSLFVSGGTWYPGWGGKASRREAYDICLEGEVTRLTDMINPRRSHGLWWAGAKHQVLVFGGRR